MPGEDFHVEIGAVLWTPDPQIVLSTDVRAAIGSAGGVDLVRDLGITKARVTEFRGALKGGKHRLRVAKTPLATPVQNFLRTVLDNGRLAVLPEIAAQFQALVNARSGISDATVYSAFAIDAAALAAVVPALEKRFAKKLNASVVVQPELIGGIRVVVGDEVLDTSVKARLEQMKTALTA